MADDNFDTPIVTPNSEIGLVFLAITQKQKKRFWVYPSALEKVKDFISITKIMLTISPWEITSLS